MSTSHTNPATPGDDAEGAVLAELATIVGEIADYETTMGPRWRRIVRALHGLGLLDVVGRDWVRIGPDGLEFAELTPTQADRLARRLEDLEGGLAPVRSTTPPPSEPLFVFPVPVVPPVEPTPSSHLGGLR